MKVATAKTLDTVHTIYLKNNEIKIGNKIKKYVFINNAIKLYIKYKELKINLWKNRCQKMKIRSLDFELRYPIPDKLVL